MLFAILMMLALIVFIIGMIVSWNEKREKLRKPDGMDISVNWFAAILLLPVMLIFPEEIGGYFLACAIALGIGVTLSNLIGHKAPPPVSPPRRNLVHRDPADCSQHFWWRE
jgi:dolichol kinase